MNSFRSINSFVSPFFTIHSFIHSSSDLSHDDDDDDEFTLNDYKNIHLIHEFMFGPFFTFTQTYDLK